MFRKSFLGRWKFVSVIAIMFAGCGRGGSDDVQQQAVDAATVQDTGSGSDASTIEDSGPGSDSASIEDSGSGSDAFTDAPVTGAWAKVDKTLRDSFTTGYILGDFVVLEVFASSGSKVHSVSAGTAKDHDEPFPVASASKWISSTVFLSLAQDGVMSLDDTTGKVLGWTEPELSGISLRHLLSFTSGLDKNLCTYNRSLTLAECAEKIHQKGLKSGATVGKTFQYGSQHMTVAAAMAEKVSGKSWKELFSERVAKPAGFTAADAYYTSPSSLQGETNPLVSGGLVISINDYERFLTVLQGIGGSPLISSSLFTEQHAEQWSQDVTVASSPNPPIHYALGCWRECATPDDVQACDGDLMVHSAGAYGFVPFIDLKNHFYGVLAARSESGQSGAARHSIKTVNKLRPMIAEAMAQ